MRELYRALTRPMPAVPTGAQLRTLRLETGLTQRTLATRLGVTSTMISRIENGQLRTPALRHRIHDLLACPTPSDQPATSTQLAA